MTAPSLRVVDRIADVPRQAWDALSDPRLAPFTSFAFLEALEASGCVAPARGWRPRHLTLWRGERLVAAAPAYVKSGWEGDFARDWTWGHALERAGIRYDPRLLVTVPITPVTGPRLLVAPGEDRQVLVRALVDAAREVANGLGLSSFHVLFPTDAEAAELEGAGMARRLDFQAHWTNRGYRDPDDWLARGLDSKRRRQARIERAAPAVQGIEIRTIRGEELAADRGRWGREVARLYHATVDKLGWNRPWLNEAFFVRLFEGMPEPLEVVAATRGGRLIAGAFNVQAGDRLFGRYWGCTEDHDYLHFNVCLHHGIDDCIARGLAAFEGGAGGEHKLLRGFELAATHGAHAFVDREIDRQIKQFLARERAARAAELAQWHNRRQRKTSAQP